MTSTSGPIPPGFRALLATRSGDRVETGVASLDPADLPAGGVEIRVAWSDVNYKDALATRPGARVARVDRLVPGIDLAGTVVASADPAWSPGDPVIVHGYDLGTARHGGFAEFARVPADWVVALPAGLSLRESMILGTAGFTAALSVDRLERHGLRPSDGPVLVTGASGGVGSTAVDLLAGRGYEVWALTGKSAEHDWLRSLGAAGFLGPEDAPADGPPLGQERWAGVVDAVGAATLPYALRTLRRGGAVALSGNAGGAGVATTVYPFILRGAALLGIDSAWLPIDERRRLWGRLADPGDLRPPHLGSRVAEHELEALVPVFEALLAGAGVGRHLVRLAGDPVAGRPHSAGRTHGNGRC